MREPASTDATASDGTHAPRPGDRYRVWCLSWEDDEEDGRDVVLYDPIYGTRPSGVVVAVSSYSFHGPGCAAEAYAEFAHSHRDGYESPWPLTFRVRKPDGSSEDFDVERDLDPTFSARRTARGGDGT